MQPSKSSRKDSLCFVSLFLKKNKLRCREVKVLSLVLLEFNAKNLDWNLPSLDPRA